MGGLSGKVAGVQISSAGNTGTSQKVLIRGISSLNNNSPLYIVDGVPMITQLSVGALQTTVLLQTLVMLPMILIQKM